jgi:hypothetical protein
VSSDAGKVSSCTSPCRAAQRNSLKKLLGPLPLQVLSDPEKRKIYDQFGEEGLKNGFGGGGGGGGGFGGFHPRAAEDIFAEVSSLELLSFWPYECYFPKLVRVDGTTVLKLTTSCFSRNRTSILTSLPAVNIIFLKDNRLHNQQH